MKKSILTVLVLANITAFFIACNSKKEEATVVSVPIDKEQIKTEIQSIETAFADEYNTKVIDSLTYYAADATSFLQNRAPLVSKAEILKSMAEDAANFPKGYKMMFSTNEVFPSSDGNQVVEVGGFKVVDSTNATINSGNYMSLFEKRDGKYICLRDMAASEKGQ